MSFQEDSLETIYNELAETEEAIELAGMEIKRLAREAAEKQAEYERCKNTMLIQMFKDEAASGTKRTEAQRTAVYRVAYSEQRLEAKLAENALSAERDYLRGLQSKLSGIQSRKGILTGG